MGELLLLPGSVAASGVVVTLSMVYRDQG